MSEILSQRSRSDAGRVRGAMTLEFRDVALRVGDEIHIHPDQLHPGG